MRRIRTGSAEEEKRRKNGYDPHSAEKHREQRKAEKFRDLT
jgi:hypothetical protein